MPREINVLIVEVKIWRELYEKLVIFTQFEK